MNLNELDSGTLWWAHEADIIKSKNPSEVSIAEAVVNSMPSWAENLSAFQLEMMENNVVFLVTKKYEEVRAHFHPKYKMYSGSEKYLELLK